MFLMTFWIKYPTSSDNVDISTFPCILYLCAVNICVHACAHVCVYVSTSLCACGVMRDVKRSLLIAPDVNGLCTEDKTSIQEHQSTPAEFRRF